MEPKCLRVEEFLAEVTITVVVSIVVGLIVGCLLLLLCWIVYKYLLPRFKQSSKAVTDNSTAPAEHELKPIHRKPLLPPHKKVTPKGSTSTTSSMASHSDGNNLYQQGMERVPNRDVPCKPGRDEANERYGKTRPRPPVQWEQLLPTTTKDEDSDPTYLNIGTACSLPQEQRESYSNMYENFNSPRLRKQHSKEEKNLNMHFSKDSPQAEEDPVYQNFSRDYENLGASGVQAWLSDHTVTEHGYLFMGKAPHEKEHPRPPP